MRGLKAMGHHDLRHSAQAIWLGLALTLGTAVQAGEIYDPDLGQILVEPPEFEVIVPSDRTEFSEPGRPGVPSGQQDPAGVASSPDMTRPDRVPPAIMQPVAPPVEPPTSPPRQAGPPP
ncbi:MAG TPA: hypothetical protein PLQ11_09315, partial [Beijerinckiaceae bacterium]|nr:hypothetical protein [Beijerinckiaceae bacterium]